MERALILCVGLLGLYHVSSQKFQKKREVPDSKAKLELIKSLITEHPNFPEKGVLFRDIFPILRNHKAMEALVSLLDSHIQTLGKIDAVVALDSRGFLLGPILALNHQCGFVPVRKTGKLPGDCTTIAYQKEYGKDGFDIQKDSLKKGMRVIIFDDLLATGGSLKAACELVRSLGGEVLECIVIIELLDLQGKKNVPSNLWSLCQY